MKSLKRKAQGPGHLSIEQTSKGFLEKKHSKNMVTILKRILCFFTKQSLPIYIYTCLYLHISINAVTYMCMCLCLTVFL